ncbi:MAG: DUF5668 domain-containing protein [Chloroflexota bacterium]
MSKQDSGNDSGFSSFPFLLILFGVFFLLRNLGTLPDANWGALFQLWPLGLILLGLNLVAQNGPRALRGPLSFLLTITAVSIAVFVLFFSEDNALLARLGIRTTPVEMMSETISFDPQDISQAEVELNLSSMGGDIYALEPNGDLINGEVFFSDRLIFEAEETNDGEAKVLLDTNNFGTFNWNQIGEDQRWQIGLNPRTPLDLLINSGSGSIDLDLDSMTITDLTIDLGSGSSGIALPDGDYDVDLDVGSGATRIAFPANGRISATLDGGSGSFSLVIPEGMPARVDIDSGSGGINLDSRFTLIEGERNGDGIWETEGYSRNGDGLELFVDIGSGSFRVTAEQ